jgi:hypothetical protein
VVDPKHVAIFNLTLKFEVVWYPGLTELLAHHETLPTAVEKGLLGHKVASLEMVMALQVLIYHAPEAFLPLEKFLEISRYLLVYRKAIRHYCISFRLSNVDQHVGIGWVLFVFQRQRRY